MSPRASVRSCRYVLVMTSLTQPMSKQIDLDPDEWQRRKKQRIEEMRRPQALPPPSGPLVSAPTNHEVAGFMPGRLEFEHEVENDAEMAVKDMDFGLVWKYGGDEQPAAKVTKPVEQEEEEEEESSDEEDDKTKVKAEKPEPKPDKGKGKAKAAEDPALDIEDEDELEVKLALLDIYFTKLDKREEAKELIFDRGLTEYKKASRPWHPLLTPDSSGREEAAKRRARIDQPVQSLCQAANGNGFRGFERGSSL